MTRQPIRRMTRTATTVAAMMLLVAGLAAAKGAGILFPDWSPPTKGTYKAPAGEVGKKGSADQPWSVTTVTSSIMGKPVAGKTTSVIGEVIDMSCYLQVGKHGDKHRDCGQKCVRNGQPVGLLTEDGSVYMLIDEEHDPRRDGLTEFRKQAVELMAHVVTVHGTATEVDGHKALYVQGSVKAAAK
ncbi:MAG: hypothetical protein HZA46_20110 [Planctomycetales bacterium]|nr:hypothetical protein [Planctomycetales bacterium]